MSCTDFECESDTGMKAQGREGRKGIVELNDLQHTSRKPSMFDHQCRRKCRNGTEEFAGGLPVDLVAGTVEMRLRTRRRLSERVRPQVL